MFLATSELDRVLRETRALGKALGFQYPVTAPQESIFDPNHQPNHLAYTALPSFQLPQLMDVMDGCHLSAEDYETIKNNQDINNRAMEDYRRQMIDNFGKLYDTMSKGVVAVDAMVQYYLQLYGHCDGSLRGLIRTKLSTLFTANLRDDARGG